MEAKDSLVKIIKALVEIGEPVTRQMLNDYLTGKDTREIKDRHYDDLESYAIGDTHDEDYWTTIIDAAYEVGFLKAKPAKSDSIVASTAGKKFAKKPSSFEIGEEEEPTEQPGIDTGIDDIMLMAQTERTAVESNRSARTKQQIKLIQAVDRKIALDDFAESESIAFDELLDELEGLVRQGRHMDITYFTDEVLGEECVDELLDFFQSVKKDHLNAAQKELGDVYSEEEIRLAYIVYLEKQTKK